MDIKGVRHVISYDSPPTARVYVHRAGRTARAGREGDVWTVLADHEAGWFWKCSRGIKRSSKIEKIKVKKGEIPQEMIEAYNNIIDV